MPRNGRLGHCGTRDSIGEGRHRGVSAAGNGTTNRHDGCDGTSARDANVTPKVGGHQSRPVSMHELRLHTVC